MTVDLSCVLLNAENLFLLLDQQLPSNYETLSDAEWQRFSTSVYPNKPLNKLLKLKRYLTEKDPDLILLTEVGGEESLRNFNQFFLNNDYRVALIEGNSDRSIDVGFLIHKRLSCHFNIVTNKERLLNFWYPHERSLPNHPGHKFSRDAAELHLFERDINKPFFIFLLTHLKSPLDPEGIDASGTARREAEFKTLLDIYEKLSKQHPETPIAVCGDLNGNASRNETDREFSELYIRTNLEDALECCQKPVAERHTFYPLKGGALLPGRQIDYVLLSKKARVYLNTHETQVIRYEIPLRGRPTGPLNFEEKQGFPSDHYPLFFRLEKIPLFPK